MFDESLVGSFNLQAGYITGYDGQPVPIKQRFFEGGDTFRGFALAGIGPRDIVAPGNTGAVGGNVFAIGTAQLGCRPSCRKATASKPRLFTDFGTVGHLDTILPRLHAAISCIKDNLAFRASAGISVAWKSPFGPVQIDLGLPFLKTSYDRPQIIHFSAGTGL